MYIKFSNMNVIPIVNKPYVNGATLTGLNLSLKCSLVQNNVKRGDSDLSKEVL